MPSTLPTRSNGYAVALKQALTREFFQAFLGDIHDRLTSLELTEADYQAAIDLITTQALAIVSANITVEVDRQRETLAEIEANAEEIAAAVKQLQNNVVPAANVSLAPIEGLSATTVQTAVAAIVAAMAKRVSPAFEGNPTAPTAGPGDRDLTIANTEFVQRELDRVAYETARYYGY